jgi:hypothetical protein
MCLLSFRTFGTNFYKDDIYVHSAHAPTTLIFIPLILRLRFFCQYFNEILKGHKHEIFVADFFTQSIMVPSKIVHITKKVDLEAT